MKLIIPANLLWKNAKYYELHKILKENLEKAGIIRIPSNSPLQNKIKNLKKEYISCKTELNILIDKFKTLNIIITNSNELIYKNNDLSKPIFWYNEFMLINQNTNGNYTPRQLRLPLEIEKLIDISDPVYTFCEVVDHIDLSKYFVAKGYKTGRPKYDEQTLLKVILFAFMEHGICSLREIEKLCRNDIRYMYLLDGMKAPTFATFENIIRNELVESIEQIFLDVNQYIFEKDHVDLEHTYIDGTKIVANSNRYTWV